MMTEDNKTGRSHDFKPVIAWASEPAELPKPAETELKINNAERLLIDEDESQ